MKMKNKFIIPEGSKVLFELNGVGNDEIFAKAEAYEDMEVLSDYIIIVDNGLYCTDSLNPVEKVDGQENTYKVKVYLQDAYLVKNNSFYTSISEVE